MTRPKRRKADPITSPDMSANEARCHAAIAPLDRLALKMDEKWGIDRLVELVSTETAAKYGSALGRLNEAIREQDPEKVRHMAGVCMRGLKAMNDEAESAGHQPPELLAEYDLDGFHFGVMRENGDWRAVEAQRPGLRLFSMREVAIALQQFENVPAIKSIKDNFPMAEIGKPKLTKEFFDNGGDDIPF